MCRWMAWLGRPVLIEELLFNTQHGIVDQSLHARMGAEPTNGDGFGLGWYGSGDGPAVYRSVAPAWADANVRELAAHTESPLFLTRIRAAIGSPVQQTNCHPFRARPLAVRAQRLHRPLPPAAPRAHARDRAGAVRRGARLDRHRGAFHLALTLGLERQPVAALERTVGVIEQTARRYGIAGAVQATFGVSDGESVWVVRYATDGPARSLFASADVDSIRRLHPDHPRFPRLSADDRLIVSEPFSDLPGVWPEIAEATAVTVRPGGLLEERPFTPQPAG